MGYWMKNGAILVDNSGMPIDCDECPCLAPCICVEGSPNGYSTWTAGSGVYFPFTSDNVRYEACFGGLDWALPQLGPNTVKYNTALSSSWDGSWCWWGLTYYCGFEACDAVSMSISRNPDGTDTWVLQLWDGGFNQYGVDACAMYPPVWLGSYICYSPDCTGPILFERWATGDVGLTANFTGFPSTITMYSL